MIDIDTSLVERLVARQFPQWSSLAIHPVLPGGWNNRTFRMGGAFSVRLPSAERYVAQVEKEYVWLPRLMPHLPQRVPQPVALGRPDEGYPWPWAVYRWIEGEAARRECISDLPAFARDLAAFMKALWKIDASDGPPPGRHNFFRGGELAVYDDEARRSIVILADEIDVSIVTEIWERALSSRWELQPLWVHGDVSEGNMLVDDGRLSAVIDFGTCGTGDPSCDLVIAWTLLDPAAASIYRHELGMDDRTWERARGWCLWKALIKIVELRDDNPAEADIYRGWLSCVVEDHRQTAV